MESGRKKKNRIVNRCSDTTTLVDSLSEVYRREADSPHYPMVPLKSASRTVCKVEEFCPRVLRLKNAPTYLGMDKNRFNREVRPYVTEITIGKQGIGFDRLDLDEWFEEYKSCNGRPGKQKGGKKPWDEKRSRVSFKGMGYGTSTRSLEEEEFAKALERARSKRRKDSSR